MLASIYFFILLELAVVSYADLLYKKIKNHWSILNICIFFVFIIIIPGGYQLKFDHFVLPLIFLGVGFLLFVLKIMGAGDTKFLSTLFLLVPLNLQYQFLLLLLYVTIFVGVLMLIFNSYTGRTILYNAFVNRDISRVKKVFGSKFTYAPVILLAWIWLGWEFLEVVAKK